jgi:hypothetical protein
MKVGSVRKRAQSGRKTGSIKTLFAIGCAGTVAKGGNVYTTTERCVRDALSLAPYARKAMKFA